MDCTYIALSQHFPGTLWPFVHPFTHTNWWLLPYKVLPWPTGSNSGLNFLPNVVNLLNFSNYSRSLLHGQQLNL